MTLLSDFFGGGGSAVVSGMTGTASGEATSIVGYDTIPAQSIAGASLNTLMPNVAADITAPAESDWGDIVDVVSTDELMECHWTFVNIAGNRDPWVVSIDSTEATDTKLRVQAITDDIVISDWYLENTLSGGASITIVDFHNDYAYSGQRYQVKKGFKLRSCRAGTDFAGSSYINVQTLFLRAIKLI